MTNNTDLYVNRRQESNWHKQGRADAIDGFLPPLHWPLQYAEGYAMHVGIRYRLWTLDKPALKCDCKSCIKTDSETPPTIWRCDALDSSYHASAYSASGALSRLIRFTLADRANRARVETPAAFAYSAKEIKELFESRLMARPSSINSEDETKEIFNKMLGL